MRASRLLVLVPFLCQSACFASGFSMGSAPSPGGSPTTAAPAGSGAYMQNVYQNPYINNPYPFGNPYGNPYVYGNPYGYRSPYGYQAPLGYTAPIAGGFQPYGGNCYGLSFNGRDMRLWRSQSGYYYPWVAGYAYNTYPIFYIPQGQTNPAAVLPPVSVVVSDLDDYLDKAKEKGKVSDNDFLSLKRRAHDLLSKEKSLAYEAGGSLDPDQEADIRRDVDELSGEVARRVRP
ncbi:MAG: hypothetical protein C5B53_11560 [Candidatus Melainabacteria bacterium]|nr:MAG: hypothetical protein C5B53_11560 [Candidatus Melainabacteria bacterium]